jgi:DNA-binding CsgD family transcriptional regulator
MTNIQIPSGLVDENIELFSVNGKVMATHNGSVKHLYDLPFHFIELLTNEMYASPSIVLALQMAGFRSKKAQLEKFAECRFGGYDFTADFKEGQFSEAEYHDCGYRGECPMEGVVCGFFKINGHIITPFEIQMIQLLATEDTIPVMAEKLKVCMNTFETKKQKLYEKLEVLSRPRAVAKAYNFQILKLCS